MMRKFVLFWALVLGTAPLPLLNKRVVATHWCIRAKVFDLDQHFLHTIHQAWQLRCQVITITTCLKSSEQGAKWSWQWVLECEWALENFFNFKMMIVNSIKVEICCWKTSKIEHTQKFLLLKNINWVLDFYWQGMHISFLLLLQLKKIEFPGILLEALVEASKMQFQK